MPGGIILSITPKALFNYYGQNDCFKPQKVINLKRECCKKNEKETQKGKKEDC